ncbi:MAG: bacillithiol system redox-active protein YtxJ [Ferruginibacter sp.]
MNWIELTSEIQLTGIQELSRTRPQVIFKHSTRCSISSMAKSRLERHEQPDATDFYLLDLIRFRSLSNKIADNFKVNHESPQVLLIKNNSCVYEESHNGIQMNEITEQITRC